MSKFQPETMERMRTRFVEGCQRPAPAGPALRVDQATTLWEQVRAFAGYGFNQGHATAYADVSYRSAWFKAHYPAAFLAARLANYGGFHHPAIYIAEAQRLGIGVRPPHINHSRRHFALAFDGAAAYPILWMGLSQVRSLRRSTIGALLQQRKTHPFVDLADLRARVELQPKELVHLIQCGALDGLGESRAALLVTAQEKPKATNAWQLTFDFDTHPHTSPETDAQRLQWERQVLGQPVSVHPSTMTGTTVAGCSTLDAAIAQPGQQLRLAVTRLPGWTGGKGFFISDGATYAVAIPTSKAATPRPWTPLLLTGRWAIDEWGGGWLQVEHWEVVP